MTAEAFVAFAIATFVVVIVPGPNVTVIVANSLRSGLKAGMACVLGTQLGVLIILSVLAAGLHVLLENLAVVFDYVRLIGATYLIWLGLKLLRSHGALLEAGVQSGSFSACFWQGCVVLLANPKAHLFFGAFIPQFIDPNGDVLAQTVVLGGTFMAVATVLDSSYALAAGQAGRLLSRSRVRMVERISGLCMIGGGLWLALSRR